MREFALAISGEGVNETSIDPIESPNLHKHTNINPNTIGPTSREPNDNEPDNCRSIGEKQIQITDFFG